MLKQAEVANLMLSGSLVRVMDMLLEGKHLAEWRVPEEWTARDCRPLAFEQYLRNKWGTDLGSVVLLMPVDQLSWWNYVEPVVKRPDCHARHMVRVPTDFSWKPTDKLPTFEFLLPGENLADTFNKTISQVINFIYLEKNQTHISQLCSLS
jgi:hypothetical protein